MSETLKAFYQAYAAWLDAGATHNKPFSRRSGLCGNLTIFTEDWHPLFDAMKSQFEAAGLDPEYPFGGEESYYTHCYYGTQHVNPYRTEWVRNHANNH